MKILVTPTPKKVLYSCNVAGKHTYMASYAGLEPLQASKRLVMCKAYVCLESTHFCDYK